MVVLMKYYKLLLSATLCVSFSNFAHAVSDDQVRAEINKLKIVNVKCQTVSSDPFDQNHFNCYSNVFNKASQIATTISKNMNNGEAAKALIEHNQNYQKTFTMCDQMYAGYPELKALNMQCKATNKLGWLSFMPSLMK